MAAAKGNTIKIGASKLEKGTLQQYIIFKIVIFLVIFIVILVFNR